MGNGAKLQLSILNKIVIISLVLIMVSSSTGSVEKYNTYLKEYNFAFPYNDVRYDEYGPNYRLISLPSMDIIGGAFKIQDNMTVTASITFAGKPYTNSSIDYIYAANFHFNASNYLRISIVNNQNHTSTQSINASIDHITIINLLKAPNTTLLLLNNPISPYFVGNTIIWTVDLSYVNNLIPLNQIFTGQSYYNKSGDSYINAYSSISFHFDVITAYKGTVIHSSYDVNPNVVSSSSAASSIFQDPGFLSAMYWSIGLIAVISIVYYYYKKKQR